ncbi:unnamed protein product [Trichogramma brassicae]|uniref:Uncharacterized protein n=1 Tax=Trichogramma brassicae TaxID=86971 RepID=A0A6H5IFZ1_9HYME|nr:unnamed protein product [Trichogramma brassicae]
MQKKEAGKISNKEFQKKIAAVFYYLCVVALQYITPLIILLYCTLMYKTLGGYSWEGIYKSVDFEECPAPQPLEDIKSTIVDTETEADVAQDIAAALFSVKQIFTAEIFRGIFGLATWWTLFTLFATTALGMVYQSYFTNV